MSKLVKEEVLAQFSAAYFACHGQEPSIEQNGSWFKVNGEQSVRLAGLAQMAADMQPKTAPVEAIATTSKPSIVETAAVVAQPQGKGLTPKALWRLNMAQGNKLPRGF